MSLRPVLDYGRMPEVVAHEGRLIVDTATAALPDGAARPVPGCPGFTLHEVIRHIGSMHRMMTHWVRRYARPAHWERSPPDGDLAGYVDRGIAELVAELRRHAPESPCDTWWPEHRRHGFWRRRAVHETTVHRVDAQAAAGVPVAPVAPEVALDGIDEVLLLWFGHRLAQLGMSSPQEGTVTVAAGGLSWRVAFDRATCRAWRVASADSAHSAADEPGTDRLADALVTGEPAQVYLWLWGRIPNQAVTTSGDHEAVAQLWALLRPATQ